jgi:hypothetical protein
MPDQLPCAADKYTRYRQGMAHQLREIKEEIRELRLEVLSALVAQAGQQNNHLVRPLRNRRPQNEVKNECKPSGP